ncbi:MAG: exonuclease domain-containing protein, partial [Lachnospiraceae bacterium]|nr:exonuclease domain-containing protein [Lachnospiraceae bacterium]
MNYIVLDLEWNQSSGKNDYELPFEIVEIGAVKLNRRFEIVDRFEQLIKPQIYRSMHFMTSRIIHLEKEELDKGRPFPEVMQEFLKWCGRNYIFCIWGTLDLTELQKNMCYYGMDELSAGPLKYYDIQKFFSLTYEDGKSRRALEYAVDYLHIDKDIPFHRAYSDAYYTAKVFMEIDKKDPAVEKYVSYDVFMVPQSKKEEVKVNFKTYAKYISREFPDKSVALEDKTVSSTRCYVCGRASKKRIRWFSANGKHYYSLSYCKKHGYLKGKIRMKKTEDGNVYVVKTLKLIS